MKDEKQKDESSSEEWEEFERVCRPVVEFIKKYYGTPHTLIVIDWSSAQLFEGLKSLPFKVPD